MGTYRKFIRLLMVTLTLALVIQLTAAAASAGKKTLFVENGKCLGPVILFKDAPELTREAAMELVSYIEKISGAKAELLDGTPKKIPEKAIWVGFQPVLKDLFPGINFDFKNPEEIVIAANANHLVIAGRDRWDPEVVKQVFGKRRKVTGRQFEYGTANAVYTFLQDFLGVRWLWPGESGIDVIEKETIAFEPFEYHFSPQVLSRAGLFNYSMLGGFGRSEDWVRHQRLQLDSMNIPAGHPFSSWWQKYHEKHPEIFALQPDGSRSGWPASNTGKKAGRTAKLCPSNPLVWELWLKGVQEQLKNNPAQTVFSATPNDAANSGVCVCEKCRAWDNPDAEQDLFNWLGAGQYYPNLSDRNITFARKCFQKLNEHYPDNNFKILLHGYASTRFAPAEAIPPKGMVYSYVGNFPWGTDERRADDKKKIHDWISKGKAKLIYRPNSGRQPGLPEVHLKRTMEDFRFLADYGFIGIFIDMAWEHWATCGPQYYLMGRLTWDPYLDGEAVMNDYYSRGFGPAAEEIKAYFQIFENAREAFNNNTRKSRYDWPVKMGNIKQAQILLTKAAAKVAQLPKYRRRVAFIQVGLDHSKLVVENYHYMHLLRESDGTDTVSAEKARNNYKKLQTIWEKYPMALNGRWFKPGSRRFANLHPDAPYGAKLQEIDEFKKPEKIKPAASEGWELVYSDDFKRDSLGNDWVTIDGKWEIKDGILCGAGTLISDNDKLKSKAGQYFRMEFEALADVKARLTFPGKPVPKADICDISSFIHVNPPEDNKNTLFTGFFFQFGGMHNTRNRIINKKISCTIRDTKEGIIIPHKRYKIVVQNDEGHLKHFVDGELIQDYKDKTPLKPETEQNQVGFYTYTAAKIFNVKVYAKPVK